MRQKAELLAATAAGDDLRNDDFVVGDAEVEVALLARAAEEAAVMSAAQPNAVARRGARRRVRAQRLRRRVARGAGAWLGQRDGAARRHRTARLRVHAVCRSAAAASASAASRRSSAGSSSRAERGSSGLPLAGYVLVHLGLVWLVRSLYYYSGLLPALADLGSALLGAAFAVWAAQRSDSAWLALWCFFLVQAFHV